MDLVSGVASVAAVATLATQLAKNLFQVCHDIKGAEQEIEDVANNLSLLAVVLEALEDVLRQNRQLYRPALEKSAREISERCQRIFKDIEKIAGVERGKATRKTLIAKLAWCFEKDGVKLLQASLESLKSTLNILLNEAAAIPNQGTQRERRVLTSLVIDNLLWVEKLEQLELEGQEERARSSRQEFLNKILSPAGPPGDPSEPVPREGDNGFVYAAAKGAELSTDDRPVEDRARPSSPNGPFSFHSDADDEDSSSEEKQSSKGMKTIECLLYSPRTSQIVLNTVPHGRRRTKSISERLSKVERAESTVGSLLEDYTYVDSNSAEEYHNGCFREEIKSQADESDRGQETSQDTSWYPGFASAPTQGPIPQPTVENLQRLPYHDAPRNAHIPPKQPGPVPELATDYPPRQPHAFNSGAQRPPMQHAPVGGTAPAFSNAGNPGVPGYAHMPEPFIEYGEQYGPGPRSRQRQVHFGSSDSESSYERTRSRSRSRSRTRPPGYRRRRKRSESVDFVRKGIDLMEEVAQRLSIPRIELQKMQEQCRALEQEQRIERAKERVKQETLDAIKAEQARQSESHAASERSKPVILKDCLGRSFSFPIEACRSWQAMEALITSSFIHIDALSPQVAQGNYDILGPTGDIILSQVWETVIQPGWVVELRIRSPTGTSSENFGHTVGVQLPGGSGPATPKSSMQAGSASDDRGSRGSHRRRPSIRGWLGRRKSSKESANVGGS